MIFTKFLLVGFLLQRNRRISHGDMKFQTQQLPSTVLEQDHFYSDFLLSQTTVSTNFNHLEDEARHSLDRSECSYTWYAALVTFIYHECSTERLGSNFHHMLNLLKVLIAHCAQ